MSTVGEGKSKVDREQDCSSGSSASISTGDAEEEGASGQNVFDRTDNATEVSGHENTPSDDPTRQLFGQLDLDSEASDSETLSSKDDFDFEKAKKNLAAADKLLDDLGTEERQSTSVQQVENDGNSAAEIPSSSILREITRQGPADVDSSLGVLGVARMPGNLEQESSDNDRESVRQWQRLDRVAIFRPTPQPDHVEDDRKPKAQVRNEPIPIAPRPADDADSEKPPVNKEKSHDSPEMKKRKTEKKKRNGPPFKCGKCGFMPKKGHDCQYKRLGVSTQTGKPKSTKKKPVPTPENPRGGEGAYDCSFCGATKKNHICTFKVKYVGTEPTQSVQGEQVDSSAFGTTDEDTADAATAAGDLQAEVASEAPPSVGNTVNQNTGVEESTRTNEGSARNEAVSLQGGDESEGAADADGNDNGTIEEAGKKE